MKKLNQINDGQLKNEANDALMQDIAALHEAEEAISREIESAKPDDVKALGKNVNSFLKGRLI